MSRVAITRILTVEEDGLAAIRRGLGFTGAEIERETDLTRGVLSAVERGRLYPYPRLRVVVSEFFARETGEPIAAIHARLFPGDELPDGIREAE